MALIIDDNRHDVLVQKVADCRVSDLEAVWLCLLQVFSLERKLGIWN